MKILMVVHSWWRRDLGIARIQMELAEEFRKSGHTVEKFSYEDVFPVRRTRLDELTMIFSPKAREFVKLNAHRFDIIDAHQSDLPFSKQEMGFSGLLVVRSAGLDPLYEETYRSYGLNEIPWSLKGLLVKLITYPSLRYYRRAFLPSFKAADLIILPNYDELNYLSGWPGLKEKCRVLPFGLSAIRQEAFTQAAQPASERLKNKEVVFIGYWSPRKGSRDWASIIRQVRLRQPEARFKFLGTGLNEEKVLNSLAMSAGEGIKVVPHFDSEDLPELLSGAAVGAFPSYVEGFGFAVLEKLACGLPVVAYDAPGAREMLRCLKQPLMVKTGDTESFAANIVKLLNMDEEGYCRLSAECLSVAHRFSWPEIAALTLSAYAEFLKKI